jgi:hypothetical protein
MSSSTAFSSTDAEKKKDEGENVVDDAMIEKSIILKIEQFEKAAKQLRENLALLQAGSSTTANAEQKAVAENIAAKESSQDNDDDAIPNSHSAAVQRLAEMMLLTEKGISITEDLLVSWKIEPAAVMDAVITARIPVENVQITVSKELMAKLDLLGLFKEPVGEHAKEILEEPLPADNWLELLKKGAEQKEDGKEVIDRVEGIFSDLQTGRALPIVYAATLEALVRVLVQVDMESIISLDPYKRYTWAIAAIYIQKADVAAELDGLLASSIQDGYRGVSSVFFAAAKLLGVSFSKIYPKVPKTLSQTIVKIGVFQNVYLLEAEELWPLLTDAALEKLFKLALSTSQLGSPSAAQYRLLVERLGRDHVRSLVEATLLEYKSYQKGVNLVVVAAVLVETGIIDDAWIKTHLLYYCRFVTTDQVDVLEKNYQLLQAASEQLLVLAVKWNSNIGKSKMLACFLIQRYSQLELANPKLLQQLIVRADVAHWILNNPELGRQFKRQAAALLPEIYLAADNGEPSRISAYSNCLIPELFEALENVTEGMEFRKSLKLSLYVVLPHCSDKQIMQLAVGMRYYWNTAKILMDLLAWSENLGESIDKNANEVRSRDIFGLRADQRQINRTILALLEPKMFNADMIKSIPGGFFKKLDAWFSKWKLLDERRFIDTLRAFIAAGRSDCLRVLRLQPSTQPSLLQLYLSSILMKNGDICDSCPGEGEGDLHFYWSNKEPWTEFGAMLCTDVLNKPLVVDNGSAYDAGGPRTNLYYALGKQLRRDFFEEDDKVGDGYLLPRLTDPSSDKPWSRGEWILVGRAFHRAICIDRRKLDLDLHPALLLMMCSANLEPLLPAEVAPAPWIGELVLGETTISLLSPRFKWAPEGQVRGLSNILSDVAVRYAKWIPAMRAIAEGFGSAKPCDCWKLCTPSRLRAGLCAETLDTSTLLDKLNIYCHFSTRDPVFIGKIEARREKRRLKMEKQQKATKKEEVKSASNEEDDSDSCQEEEDDDDDDTESDYDYLMNSVRDAYMSAIRNLLTRWPRERVEELLVFWTGTNKPTNINFDGIIIDIMDSNKGVFASTCSNELKIPVSNATGEALEKELDALFDRIFASQRLSEALGLMFHDE